MIANMNHGGAMDPVRQRLQLSPEALRDDDFLDSSWMHASGWAQLSSERRTLSCVLLGLASPGAIREVMPALSDFLTEVGYPWEVLAVDVSDNAKVGHVQSQWTGERGIRRIVLPAGTSAAQLLTASLRTAQGDVVLLLSERGFASLGLVPTSASRLEEATRAVRAKLHATTSEMPPDEHRAAGSATAARVISALWEDVTLLDRKAIELLLSDR
jgi:hypothetical protein